jgi:hypothetical protein
MTVNLEENTRERDVLIFRTHLTGIGIRALAVRNGLSYGRVEQILVTLTREVLAYLKEHNLPMPEASGRLDRIKDQAFWNAALDNYLEELRNKTGVTIHDPVIKIGVSEKLAKNLDDLEIRSIGDLLNFLKTKKHRILRFFNGNAASMDSLERKIRRAGFDPNGGRDQEPNQK